MRPIYTSICTRPQNTVIIRRLEFVFQDIRKPNSKVINSVTKRKERAPWMKVASLHLSVEQHLTSTRTPFEFELVCEQEDSHDLVTLATPFDCCVTDFYTHKRVHVWEITMKYEIIKLYYQPINYLFLE